MSNCSKVLLKFDRGLVAAQKLNVSKRSEDCTFSVCQCPLSLVLAISPPQPRMKKILYILYVCKGYFCYTWHCINNFTLFSISQYDMNETTSQKTNFFCSGGRI